MKRGQIIRRRMGNRPIGPFMIITAVNKDYVSCEYLESELETLVLKDRVYPLSVKRLLITDEQYKELFKREPVISHKISKNWLDICDNKYDLLQMYHRPTKHTVYATYHNAYRAFHRVHKLNTLNVVYEVKVQIGTIVAVL